MDAKLAGTIADVEAQYQRLFLTPLATLLTEDGAYLSFVGGMAAIDALACYYGGAQCDAHGHFQNEAMFTAFVRDLFPADYHQQFNLWHLRNSIIHRFVVHTGFILKFDDPEKHAKRHGPNMIGLDAKRFLHDLSEAATNYFARLRSEPDLQRKFEAVCTRFGVLAPSRTVTLSDTPGTAATSYVTVAVPSSMVVRPPSP